MMPLRLLPSFAAARFRRRWDLRLGRRLASWLPLGLLLLAISTVYWFGDGWGRFQNYRYTPDEHDSNSAKNMVIAENLSPAHNFLMFLRQYPGPGGTPTYEPYTRFPVGGFVLIKLVILPFGDDLSAKLYAARMLMLLMFAGAAALAYLSLRRITSHGGIALAATLSAFSGGYTLYFSDVVSNEMAMDLFGVLLVFHGMTILVQEGRFGQLLAKTCLALLLGWHVYALLLPFIVFGLGREIVWALQGNRPGKTVIARIISVAAALIHSRYIRLGAVALLFGLLLLSFNFANEYAALGSETPFRELPSVRSMLKRAGQSTEFNANRAEFLAWETFLPEQFRRIGQMVLPYAVTVHTGGFPCASSMCLLSLTYVAVGMGAAGVCLLGLLFLRRRRMLLATLVLGGLCWGIGMRFNTAVHNFESVFYVGVPLVLFTMILLGLRGRWGTRLAAVAAVVAVAVFALSAYQMEQTEARARALFLGKNAGVMSDFQQIRRMTPGKRVYVQNLQDNRRIIYYYLTGSVLQLDERPIADCGPQCGRYYDFVVSSDRNLFPETHLLTPSNHEVFLFDTGGIDTDGLTAGYRSEYDSVISGDYGEPTVRAEYDLFIADGKVVYYKSRCSDADTADRFFLHTFPNDRNDLPETRLQHGFDNLDFDFIWRGVVFDGNCIAVAPLPDYAVASIRTGQFAGDFFQTQEVWSVAIMVKSPIGYAAAAAAIAAGGYGEPVGRGVFEVYLSETAVVYFKESCDAGDTGARFFLHFVPEDAGDLPMERQGHGFDNRDFSFAESGVMTSGRCLALAPLPDYAVARVRTGQFAAGEGRLWAVEFAGGRLGR